MVFVGVYKALYDYTPSGEGELAISEGDLLYILEKSSDDDWWKAKKRAESEDDDEPEGLIPNNYVEEATPVANARALYDYSRQTDEELSFSEDATLDVYDMSDPDWTLVGLDGEFGFAPSNYIEEAGAAAPSKPPRPMQQPTPQPEPEEEQEFPSQSPAVAIAGLIHQKTGTSAPRAPPPQLTPEPSDEEEAPQLPRRPPSQSASPAVSIPRAPQPPAATSDYETASRGGSQSDSARLPAGYQLFNIHEMISHMGKNKKMPTTLGIDVGHGTILIATEKSKEQREWTADKLTHYSIEGKHVFMELVKPSKSIDFHAGSKDIAQEIVAHLGELAGAAKAEGLREVLAASSGTGMRKGEMSFEFMAQGEDEVTVAAGDEVIILDDSASEDWWQVRRLKNGKEGVVPASYVKIVGHVASATASTPSTASNGLEAGMSTVERNRREEQRQAKEAARTMPKREDSVNLPDRYSSLGKEKSRSSARGKSRSTSESLPNQAKIREWTDRTGSFKVEAEFLGLKDGKIHLHKQNGVKIAVPVAKMSLGDIEYVELMTGRSLEDEKPLSDIKRRSSTRKDTTQQRSRSGAAIEAQAPKYDWFDFFLQCGVNPQICERYSAAFDREQMGEESLGDIQPTLLRTLGLKEGDILRVMKFLDTKFSRSKDGPDGQSNGGGGLFSGPGGALKPRKGRPAPAVANNNTVDPRAFEQDALRESSAASPPVATPAATSSPAATLARATSSGFDDNAWDLRPSKKESTPARIASPPSTTTSPPPRAPAGDLAGLSLMDEPLVPTKAAPPPAAVQTQPSQPQATGADRAFFDQLARPGSQSGPRQRPQPPQQISQQTGLIAPPPSRPMSAPQNQSAFAPPPLQAQLTGFQAPHLARPGLSMSELNQQRMQPQMTGYGMMPQPTGFQQPMPTGYPQFPQQGFQYQPSVQQQYMQGQMTGSPFADPPRAPFQPLQPQQTGYNQMMPQPTGINSFLPPALQPQRTGPSPNGYSQQPGGFAPQPTGFAPQPIQQQMSPPPMPPQQPTSAPLIPQKTGPAPPVRFGMQPSAKPLAPQPTGRANLANATPQNPFGF